MILTFALLCLLCAPLEAHSSPEIPDSLHLAALEQVGRVPLKQCLKAFRRVLKADRSYAPAHYEIARLYMSLKTPRNNQKARLALDRAIRIDPENATYQLALGDLLWNQGFRYNARKQHEKVLQHYPANANAAYEFGRYYLKEVIKYQNMINIEGQDRSVGMNWAHYADGYRDKAMHYLQQSIELDPGLRKAYYRLGLLYLESERPIPPAYGRALVEISEQLLRQDAEDKNALLFRGLASHTLGKFREAHQFYQDAFRRMEPRERAVLESVELIASEEERERIVHPPLMVDGESSKWIDGPERARFWHWQDPLYLTEYNEYRMEHYRRVAYANLRYGRPWEGKPGWETDAGKSYIKFGQFRHRITRRPEISPSGRLAQPYRETWFYEGFTITFRNRDGLDGWRFDTTYSPVGPSPREVFNRTPPRYVDPYLHEKYSLPHQVAAFQEGDSVRLELSYVLPKNRLESSGSVSLEDGVFLFDEYGREIYRNPFNKVRLAWQVRADAPPANADSLRENYLLSQNSYYVAPGPYRLVVEARDRNTGSVGTFQEQRTFSFPDSALAMSDLMLAGQIETHHPLPEKRADLEITSNPLRTYRRSEPVFIYLEVYNLTRDAFGSTQYRIAYRLGRPRKKEIDPALFAPLDFPEAHAILEIELVARKQRRLRGLIGAESTSDYEVNYILPEADQLASQITKVDQTGKGPSTTITAEYQGDRKNDLTYLQLDVARVPSGVHKLTVIVEDVRTGQKVERDVLFRVIQEAR